MGVNKMIKKYWYLYINNNSEIIVDAKSLKGLIKEYKELKEESFFYDGYYNNSIDFISDIICEDEETAQSQSVKKTYVLKIQEELEKWFEGFKSEYYNNCEYKEA